MVTLELQPRFYETDAFGHINNTVIPRWFETGREPVFRVFSADLDPTRMPLILARIEIDFVAQVFYGAPVEIRTGVEKLGNSSFTVVQEAWQRGQCVARGRAVQVYFDHQTQRSQPLTEAHRARLGTLMAAPPKRSGDSELT